MKLFTRNKHRTCTPELHAKKAELLSDCIHQLEFLHPEHDETALLMDFISIIAHDSTVETLTDIIHELNKQVTSKIEEVHNLYALMNTNSTTETDH